MFDKLKHTVHPQHQHQSDHQGTMAQHVRRVPYVVSRTLRLW